MLKTLYHNLFSSQRRAQGDDETAARTISRQQHGISRKQISRNALTVIYDLRRAGFDAYLVGGGVRDLLLGGQPKDFDVATDATPEQVQQQFKRARIVGRRFKIVHVRFGRELIEVTTFRADHSQQASQSNPRQQAQTNTQGMLVRDNVYGSLREDALRRDFTVNALYYSVDGFTVLDYADGMRDLQQRKLRMIGEPATRYAEDPVRMLRAVRFAAKLDFQLERETAEAIQPLAHLLRQVAPARLFDEVSKLFLSGHGFDTLTLLQQHQLLEILFPATRNSEAGQRNLLEQALRNTDQRIAEGKPVTPAFLYAALLWPTVCRTVEEEMARGTPRLPALQAGGQRAIEEQLETVAIPRRFSSATREIWTLQQRLQNARGKRALAVLQHPRFRAAYDFLLLREASGEDLDQRGKFWTELQRQHPLDDDSREANQHNAGSARRRRRPARRRRRRPGSEKSSGEQASQTP